MIVDSEIIRIVKETNDQGGDDSLTPPRTWWARYKGQLSLNGLSESSIKVIDYDSQYISDLGVLAISDSLDPDRDWPTTRVRRGLVMGAVQSGKTASLIAVIAKALDRKVDIIVILGGTRISLWRQTYERIVSQLDQWSIDNDSDRRSERVLLPSPSIFNSSRGLPELTDLYFETPNMVRRMLIEQRPLIAVVMKQSDHLMRFSKYLHEVLNSTFSKSSRRLSMLVIDDEADDGSILDSDIERGLSPDSDLLKQIPRHIQRLWSGTGASVETISEKLFATYLAYTATPQANFLQSDHNPLSPTEFISALRTPLDTGPIDSPRESTFREDRGIGSYYTGGELFYRRFCEGDGALCKTVPFPHLDDQESSDDFDIRVEQVRSDLLSESLRAFFVSGAIRLLISQRSLVCARIAVPDSESNIRAITPPTHSMLFHPSARIETHFSAAQEIAAWSARLVTSNTTFSDIELHQSDLPRLCISGLIARLQNEEADWKKWIFDFEKSRQIMTFIPSGDQIKVVDESHWSEIKRLLVEEVFPHTRLSIINSDPRADERPKFALERIGHDKYLPPRDIFTIFISGNVMSRGLTLEGLATTLFLRLANEPVADTQMQMQRWFGYRGKYLNLCRVFLFADQFELFRSYHENDEALRREVLGEMNCNPGVAPNPTVIQGRSYRATGKISNLGALPLCPGADPFIRVIETGSFAEHNAAILSSLLESGKWSQVIVGNLLRGSAMERQLSLLEVAELLESFRYSKHNPNPNDPNHLRWISLASQNNLSFPDAPLFRPPNLAFSNVESVSPPSCPYTVAAYLRLWNALLTRRARGIIPTDDRVTPWSMIDLKKYAASAPKFYVGVRYGSAGLSKDVRLSGKGILRMDRGSRDDVLTSTWGSRNPGQSADAYLGDQLFDYHVHELIPPVRVNGEPLWRKRGSPGLVLFHVIRGDGDKSDSVTVGLALPLGGPDHIAALRPGI